MTASLVISFKDLLTSAFSLSFLLKVQRVSIARSYKLQSWLLVQSLRISMSVMVVLVWGGTKMWSFFLALTQRVMLRFLMFEWTLFHCIISKYHLCLEWPRNGLIFGHLSILQIQMLLRFGFEVKFLYHWSTFELHILCFILVIQCYLFILFYNCLSIWMYHLWIKMRQLLRL